MSRFAEVSFDWAGEERTFRLSIGQIGKLQEKVGAGPLGIAARCQLSIAALSYQRARDWIGLSGLNLTQLAEHSQVREVFLRGLIGAGVALPDADKLVREWVDERPLAESLMGCIAICQASIYGVEDEEPMGESQAAAAASQNSQTKSSGSAKAASTRSALPADSAPSR